MRCKEILENGTMKWMAWQPAFTVKLDHLTTVHLVRRSDLSHTCPLRRLQGGDLWCQFGVGRRDLSKHSSEAHLLLQKVFWIQLIPRHTATSCMFLLVMYLYRCQMSCLSTSFCFEFWLPSKFFHLPAALPTKNHQQFLFSAFGTDRCVARWKNVSGVWTTTRFGMVWRLGEIIGRGGYEG